MSPNRNIIFIGVILNAYYSINYNIKKYFFININLKIIYRFKPSVNIIFVLYKRIIERNI